MHRFFASLLTISLLFLPTVAVQADSHVDDHTNIPDTHRYVANEIASFSQFVSRPDVSNEELIEAFSDLNSLLQSYSEILERRADN
jgi:hypothetical protein